MRNLPVLVAFAAIAACPIAATHAEGADIPRTETVQFGDLDLSSQQGAIALFRRLHSAAHDVCNQPAGDPAFAVGLYKYCVTHALREAVSTVDQPVLTAYAQENGVSIASRKGARPN
jgi:UrcA family protein